MAKQNRRSASQTGGPLVIAGLVWLLALVVWLVMQIAGWTPFGRLVFWALVSWAVVITAFVVLL